jgi:acyl dehydratase
MSDTIQRHKRGGLYLEDFEVGKLYEHRYTRTVTQMDNMLFSNMTLNPQPLHIDRHFCETETEWGQPLMNSLFTLGLMIGIQVSDMTVGTTIATPYVARRRWCRSANPSRGRAPESSPSITRRSSRTASSLPSVTATRSS